MSASSPYPFVSGAVERAKNVLFAAGRCGCRQCRILLGVSRWVMLRWAAETFVDYDSHGLGAHKTSTFFSVLT